MTAQILVTYTSRSGSTAEIAAAIGKELQNAGYTTDITDMKETASVDGYQAVVMGAPVYAGHIEKRLISFIDRNRQALGNVPLAAFVVGIAPVYPKAGTADEVLDQVKKSLAPLEPSAVTMFAGRLEYTNQSFLKRTMIHLMKVPTGDFRDWDEISAWARRLPALLIR